VKTIIVPGWLVDLTFSKLHDTIFKLPWIAKRLISNISFINVFAIEYIRECPTCHLRVTPMNGESILFLFALISDALLLFGMVFYVLPLLTKIILFSDLECDYINPIDLYQRLTQVHKPNPDATNSISLLFPNMRCIRSSPSCSWLMAVLWPC
jgi:Cornichon protein